MRFTKGPRHKKMYLQGICEENRARSDSKAAICCVPFIYINIGIKHGFSCINIRQVPRKVFKTEVGGRGFQHFPGDLANVNALKNMFDRYYYIKTENICYISRYFLHYFVSPSHRCHANAISTDYTRYRAGQFASRSGS